MNACSWLSKKCPDSSGHYHFHSDPDWISGVATAAYVHTLADALTTVLNCLGCHHAAPFILKLATKITVE